jgi:hypothetical protein
MCNESWLRRRREAEESRELWRDFTGTRPIDDREPREVTEPERAEAREEEVASTDR